MPELRWALLILGLVFLLGLGWREFRRPRQARSTRPGGPGAPEPADSGRPDFTLLEQEPARDRRVRQEPTLDLPPVETVDDAEGSLSLPILDPRDEPATQARVEPELQPDIEPMSYEPAAESHLAMPAEPDLEAGPLDTTDENPVVAHAGDDSSAYRETSAEDTARGLQDNGPEPDVAQPERPEKVVVVRVVPPSPERFGGRSLRQAFADSGFVHGSFGIYHAHDTTGRTLASAANLMRPGTFDPESMDDQWFHGLKLFIVLPGPLPPVRAVDELVAAARRIAGKLGGSLQDDVGRPLTLSGLAQIKTDLAGMTEAP